MIISINGPAGSGKSTIAKRLAAELGWQRYYMGGLRRQKARERGMTLAEYNKFGESDPTTDTEVDEYQTELGKTQDNFIIEGRTSWHFIPHSFKIYLDVDEKVGARRVFNQLSEDNRRNEDKNLNTEEKVFESQRQRLASDDRRYRKYFNIDIYDKNNYDMIVNTSNLKPEEVLRMIIKKLDSLKQSD